MEQYFVSIYRFGGKWKGRSGRGYLYIFICIYEESGSKVLADARKGRRTAVADANGGCRKKLSVCLWVREMNEMGNRVSESGPGTSRFRCARSNSSVQYRRLCNAQVVRCYTAVVSLVRDFDESFHLCWLLGALFCVSIVPKVGRPETVFRQTDSTT
jgi:hypothetical protein